jgi:hypothetical protein
LPEREFVINELPKAFISIRVKIGRMFFVRMKVGLFFLGLAAYLLNADVNIEGGADNAEV